MFSTPKSHVSMLLLVALGIAFGVAASTMGFLQQGTGIIEAALSGLFLLTAPAVLSALTMIAVKRKLAARRVFFLSFICTVLYAGFFLASIATRENFGAVSERLVFVGFGVSFVLWFLIAKIVFSLNKSAVAYAAVQAGYNFAFFAASQYLSSGQSLFQIFFKVYFAGFVFLVGAYAAFWIIDAPMKRNFGISSTKAISMFLGQWLSSSQDLEKTFESIGQDIETLVGYLSFKAKNLHLVLVVPYIHYGPFGNLGGSEFSYRICASLEKSLGCKAMAFHGTANHDFDPVSHQQLSKITAPVEKSIRAARHEGALAAYAQGKCANAHVDAYQINGCAFMGLSRAPQTTEDVDFGAGLSIMNEAEKIVPCAIAADQHNSETGDITFFSAGSLPAFQYLDAARQACAKVSKVRGQKTRLGFAQASPGSKSIGSGGIKVLDLQIGKAHNFIILFDSNGVTPAFRSRLLSKIEAGCRQNGLKLQKAEVYTTDTHQLNMIRGVLNPIGSSPEPQVEKMVLQAVFKAAGNLEEYKFHYGKERIRMRVFGQNQSTEIISTVNSIWAVARVAIPAILLASILLILYGLSKF